MNAPVSQDLPDLAYAVWILGLAVAVLIILPLAIHVLRRAHGSARRLQSDLKEMAAAEQRIEQHCRSLTASQVTMDTAALLKLAESLREQRLPLAATPTGTLAAGSREQHGGAS